MKKTKSETPKTVDLRAWVARAVVATGQKPTTISKAISPSVNLVGAFLRDPKRGITLDSAAALERFLRAAAADMNIKLPAISGAAGVSDV